ncbi:Uncharacterized protein C9orf78 [Toxocara canis]|uniref:Uncharacterized protein C9orf78 n=1 Tax=Toxocara canis TaxID=6265 RepID=A0A0B2W533_TOXCA|nr:Uncharacterized protein C9orf78 [Toxocara canis]
MKYTATEAMVPKVAIVVDKTVCFWKIFAESMRRDKRRWRSEKDKCCFTDTAMSIFKRSTKMKRYLRRKLEYDANVEEEGEDEDFERKLEDIREVQQSRVRRNGLNAVECALGKELASEFVAMDDDPFRQRGGGMLRLSEGRQAQLHAADIEAGIRDQFKKESFLRDEHEEMKKYVQAELRKRKADYEPDDAETTSAKMPSVEDKLMWKAAEKVRLFKSMRNDELLSNQMLAGIPEVDLGINARMSNIIETEKKKSEMLKDVMEHGRSLTEETLFQQERAKDLSKDYVQHSIFYMESTTRLGQEDWRKKLDGPETQVVYMESTTRLGQEDWRKKLDGPETQTQYFTQQQIDEYRQCFYLYCQEGVVESASQLRYIMRSLGYSPTVPETVRYFKDHNKKVDFASFLEILHVDSGKGDPMIEIIRALKGIDHKNQGWITVPEFVSILSSVGEKMSREEIEHVLRQLDVKSGNKHLVKKNMNIDRGSIIAVPFPRLVRTSPHFFRLKHEVSISS